MQNTNNLPGLNLLSLDGGGVTGLSSLLILREVMNRLQEKAGLPQPPDPCKYFDLIAGTGTGAISAIMLGRLRMSMDQVITAYNRLVCSVYSDKKVIALGNSGLFKARKLEEGFKKIILEATGNPDESMLEEKPGEVKCKVVIFAMSSRNMNATLPCAFRTYPANANAMPDCPIWKALRASTAHPELFKSVEIEELGMRHRFIGGAYGCNNPTAQLLMETSTLFPRRSVASVVSIGSGHSQTIQIPLPTRLERALPVNAPITSRALKAARLIAIDNEGVAQAMALRFSHTNDVYYRLNVDQGLQSIKSSEWERRDEVAEHTFAYLRQVEINNLLDTLVATVQMRSPVLSTIHIDGRISVPSSPVSMEMKYCPHATFIFKGRVLQLEQAKRYFGNDNQMKHVFVMHGPGGAGKTQAALKFAEQMAERFEGVLFIDSSSQESIETVLSGFATSKGIGNTHTDSLKWLASRRGRWLMLFDNVENPEVQLHEYFPQSSKYDILITTRHREIVSLATGRDSDCNLGEMDPREALELLLEAARVQKNTLLSAEETMAKELLQEFGYLALAIVQCGAFIFRMQCSIRQYYRMFRDERQATLARNGSIPLSLDVEDQEHSVHTTCALNRSLVGIPSMGLWHLIAFLHRNRISERIFRRAYENLQTYQPEIPPTDAEAEAERQVRQVLGLFVNNKGWSSRLFVSAMGELVSLSLVTLDTINNLYHLHPLVQQWARTESPKPDSIQNAAFLLALSIGHKAQTDDNVFKKAVAPHVNEILELCPTLESNNALCFLEVYAEANQLHQPEVPGTRVLEKENGSPSLLDTPGPAIARQVQRGRASKAEEIALQVLDTRRKTLGEDHPDTLKTKANLAMLYYEQDRVAEAESLEVELVAARKRVLGNNHPDTLTSLGNLGSTYHRQGRLAEAESLEAEVLASRTRVLGEDHPDTLHSLENLGSTYYQQGRLVEAEALQSKALAGRKRVLGEEHPSTLHSMTNLAAMYHIQGRLAEAETLEVKALDIRKRVLGDGHPETVMGMQLLAMTYIEQGRLEDAEALEIEVVAVQKRVFGAEHPETVKSMKRLAVTYFKQGRLAETESLELAVIAAQNHVLGSDHPDTLESMTDLGSTYQKQGRYKEAESLQREVLATQKRVLVADHPETLRSQANLGSTCYSLGQLTEAEALEVETLAARKRVLGDEHPDTLNTMTDLAVVYFQQGRLAEAEAIEKEALDIRKRVFGSDHLESVRAMQRLAFIRNQRGRLPEAESLEAQIVAARKQQLGEEHPETLQSMASLGSTYYKQGRLEEAASLVLQVLSTQKRVLGENHPDTLRSLANLGSTYHRQGRLDEAEALEVKALAARKLVLGPEDSETLLTMTNLAVTYHDLGRVAEAEALLVEVLNIRKRVLGNDHPKTLESMQCLAAIYCNQDRLAEAEVLESELVAAQKRIHGDKHPETLKSMRSLAITYFKQGRLADAESLQTGVVTANMQSLGESHPDTQQSMRELALTCLAQGRGAEARALIIESGAADSQPE